MPSIPAYAFPFVSPSSSLHLDAKPRNTVRILGNWRTGQMGHVRGRVARNCRGCGPTAFAHLRPYARHVGQGPPRTRTRVCVPLRAPTGSTLAPRCTRSAKVCPRPDTRSVTRADPEESGRWYRTSPRRYTPFKGCSARINPSGNFVSLERTRDGNV